MSREKQRRGFHISIVGNVGIGKSTLAKLIQRRWSCRLYLEEPEDYLFLRLFFRDQEQWGFANQLHFVMTKIAQQAQILYQEQRAVQEMYAAAIHGIWTPTSYEIGYLSDVERDIIGKVYELLAGAPISTPDLVVILQASVGTLVDRIRKRGRDYEKLDPKFVRLIEVVDHFTGKFIREISGNVMLVDTERVDFTAPSAVEEGLLDDILRQVPGP